MLETVTYRDEINKWQIIIMDNLDSTKLKENPSKLNWRQDNNSCRYIRCQNSIRRTRMSGLCDKHSLHQHDLLLQVKNENENFESIPTHIEIINNLIDWSKTRNFNLHSFFTDCSFSLLGNIPDTSTLSLEITHEVIEIESMSFYFEICKHIVERHFPENNTSSHQLIKIKGTNYPARILAMIMVGLIFCEEANRGDRWFWRVIVKNEGKTQFLGGAMPIAYYAAISFPWGMEIGRAAPKFIPQGR